MSLYAPDESTTSCFKTCLRKCLQKNSGGQQDNNDEQIVLHLKDEIRTNTDGSFYFPTEKVFIPVDIPSRAAFPVGRLKTELSTKLLENKPEVALHIYTKDRVYVELSDQSLLPPQGDLFLSIDITLKIKLIQAFHHPLSDKSLNQRTVPRRVNLSDKSEFHSKVHVAPNGTIKDVRIAIARVRSTRIQYVHLFWKGEWLTQDGVGLKTFHLKNGCTVLVRDSPWLVRVQTLQREVIWVCAHPSDCMERFRSALEPCIPPELKLEEYEFVGSDGFCIFEDSEAGQGDDDELNLDFLGIQDGCLLHLIPKTVEFPSGCKIERAEHRGITIVQLRQLAAAILRRCVQEGWRSTNPDLESKLLQPDEVTLYDLMEHYIRPLTLEKVRSYVEHIATNPAHQIPSYFCSHWWGENVLDFVACLEQHAKDRGLPDTTPYWVCAYALNQHNVTGELGGQGPKESPFYRAMHLTKGTVSVLDSNAVCYNRIWCAYEIALVMHELKKKGATRGSEYLYDVYTVASAEHKTLEVPVGLLDRVADLRKTQSREVAFPLKTLHKALTMQLERASASMQQDKVVILNSIIGNRNLSALPPQYHPSYENLNASLRAKLAESTYPIALEKNHPNLADFRLALANAPYQELSVSFNGCKEFLAEARLFWHRALPVGLSALDLDVSNLAVKRSDEFIVGLGRLSQLTKLKLTSKDCRQLCNVDQLWKEIGKLMLLEDLEVNFAGCCISGMINPWDRSSNHVTPLTRLRLNFAGSSNSGVNISGFKSASKMTELSLDVSENALASTEGTEAALAGYRDLTHLELRCKGLLRVQSTRPLTEAMVSRKMVSLRLVFNGCSGLQNLDGLGSIIRYNTNLVDVALDFQYCSQISTIDELMRGFSGSTFPNLERVSLDFGYCSRLVIMNLVLISDDGMPKLKSLRLGFPGCKRVVGGTRLLQGFNSFQGRQFDLIDINFTGCEISQEGAQAIAGALSVTNVQATSFQFLVDNGGGWVVATTE